MFSTLRRIILALFAALVLLILVTVSVQAQTWSSAKTTGLTSVESVFQNGVYTWTVTNESSLPGDTEPSYDLLIWGLMPYQVSVPQSVSTPAGWTWTGDGWSVASSSEKYRTPASIAPGQSLVFQYTPVPDGELINSSGRQPDGLGFVVHVAAVVPGSGSLDGSVKWTPTMTEFGGTWYDRATAEIPDSSPVPEMEGLFVLAYGALALVLSGARQAISRARSV